LDPSYRPPKSKRESLEDIADIEMVCNRLLDDGIGQRSALATSPHLEEDITIEGTCGPTKIISPLEDIRASIWGPPENGACPATGDGSSAALAVTKANLAGPAPNRDGAPLVPVPSTNPDAELRPFRRQSQMLPSTWTRVLPFT